MLEAAGAVVKIGTSLNKAIIGLSISLIHAVDLKEYICYVLGKLAN